MPTLSYIIPVYNGEKYLRETLNSAINQPCKDFEILIINDGSSDSSSEIIKEFEDKYDNVKTANQENSGVSASRNVGLRMAQGDFVLFLDQDDIIPENSFDGKLRDELRDYLRNNTDIIAFSGVYSNKNFSRFRIEINDLRLTDNGKCLGPTTVLPIHFAFYNRKFLLSNELYCLEKYDKVDTDQQYFHKVYMTAQIIEVRNDIRFYLFRSNFSSVSHSFCEANKHVQFLDAWYEMYLWNEENQLGGSDYCLGWLNGDFYFALLTCGYKKSHPEDLDKLLNSIDYLHLLFDTDKCAYKEYVDGFNLYKKSKKAFLRMARRKEIMLSFAMKLKKIGFVEKVYEKRRYPLTDFRSK